MLNVIKDIESPETAGARTSTGVEVKDLRLSNWGKKLLPKAIIYGTAKKADADEKLLRKHLLSERPVHIRRTLDQSYYWTLKDTSTRDRDQVVYRATKDQNPRIIMVDQLWLWILDGKLVITSFPRRWGRKKQDPSGLYRTIREQLASDRPDLNNVYDMATMMMDQCSRVFFDRAVSRDNRPEVMDIFSTAIGDVTDRSTKAYNEFWELIMPDSHRYREMLNRDPKEIWPYLTDAARRKLDKMKNEDALLEQLLDINPEGELLREIKDIQDELHMMTKVYSQQQSVVKEFVAHLDQLSSKSTEVTQKTKDKVSHLAKEVVRRKAEINELTKAAERTAEGLKELLDLKQKHANVEEARAGVLEARQAVIRAEEANNILLATRDLAQQSALQTIQGNKQNRALMLFTIVTIIFLPLGFFSSVFGMNAPEFGQGTFHLWKQFLIMFPVSIVIIVFSLALALSEDFLGFCGATLQLWWAKFLQRVGLFERWKKKGDSVRRAVAVRKERLDELYEGENRVGESV